MASSTASSCVLSWRWPAVTMTESAAPCRRRRGAPCSSILPGYVLLPRPADGRPPFYVSMARLATCASGVLVGAGDGAVHAHLPLHLAHRIGFCLRVGQQAIPGAVAPPTHETVVASLPRAVAGWQVAPGCAGPMLPEDAVDDLAMVFPLLAPSPVLMLYPSARLVRPMLLPISPRLSLPATRRLAEKDPAIRQTRPNRPFDRSRTDHRGVTPRGNARPR
jgi:hypothetical protein